MSFEVVHTSVARGLRGESGFATAIMTRGLPAGLESGLQDISGYDHDNVRAVGVDAVEWAHRIVTVRGRPYTVLSRIAPNGIDASRRPNRIAHHLVVEPHERTLGGPAWMLGKFGAFETGSPEVAERAMAPQLPLGDLAVQSTRAWEAAGFDAGWAGVIAQTIIDAPQSTLYVVMPEAIEALPLVIHVLDTVKMKRSAWTIRSLFFPRCSRYAISISRAPMSRAGFFKICWFMLFSFLFYSFGLRPAA